MSNKHYIKSLNPQIAQEAIEQACSYYESSAASPINSFEVFMGASTTLNRLRAIESRIANEELHIANIEVLDSFKLSKDKDISINSYHTDPFRLVEDSGRYLVTFSNGERLLFWRYFSGETLRQNYFVVGNYNTMEYYESISSDLENSEDQTVCTSPGVYSGTVRYSYKRGNYMQYEVRADSDIRDTPVIHESYDKLFQDIDRYFANLDKFEKYSFSNIRKCMLYGPPGTGKSSMIANVLRKYKETYRIIYFSGSIFDLNLYFADYENDLVPTIIIFEDVDDQFSEGNVDSGVLNMLEGFDMPKPKAGVYIIFTTNHPEDIDPRIINRPGRIDIKIEVGALTGKYVSECVKLYLPDEMFRQISEKQIALCEGHTGTMIKMICKNAIIESLYPSEKKFDQIFVDAVKAMAEFVGYKENDAGAALSNVPEYED